MINISPHIKDPDHLLRQQLQWLMLLRVILYTILLGISFIFQNENLEIIVLPADYLLIFISFIYVITVSSALILKMIKTDLNKFGLIQTILDTIFVSILVFYTGTSHSTFATIYFFPIIAGGLILPKKGGFAAAAAATIQLCILLTLEHLNIFPSSLSRYSFMYVHDIIVTVNHFSVKGVTFFLAAFLSALFGSRLVTAEEALTHTKQSFDQLNILYKLVFDNISTGIITLDDENKITSVNPAFEKITGYSSTDTYLIPLENIFPTLKIQKDTQRQATDIERKNGSTTRVGYSHAEFFPTPNESNSVPHPHKVLTLQDISEIETLEQKIRQAEKLAAIGMMSASIAHDFRNPLAAISGSAQVLAQEYTQRRDEAERANFDLTEIIMRESTRLIDTISNFLRFARPEHTHKDWFSLKNCIEKIIKTYNVSKGFSTSCHIRCDFEETIAIWGDQNQLTVVFNELIHNSLAHCPQHDEIIIIKAEELAIRQEEQIVIVSFSDNGSGIPGNDTEMIFEPFYTSRADGTGLGLAIVKQTIEDHGGAIEVSRSSLGGAKISLTFPSV